MTERIISQSFSFQNTTDINEHMQKHGKIQIFQNSLDVNKDGNNNGLLKYEYDKFFDTRHSIVHSIECRPYLNVRKYYNMTEKLLDYVLENVEYDSFYESCKNAALSFQNNKSDTYDRMFKKLQNERKNAQNNAREAMSQKHYEKAISYHNKVLKLDPSDMVANMENGLAFYNLKKYQQSIESCEQQLELYDSPVLYVLLGSVLQKLGEHEDAIIYFKKALEHESDKTSIYNRLSISTGSIDCLNDALQYANMTLTEKPDDITALGLKKLAEECIADLNKKNKSQNI